ncbi:MAG: hypothetical protein IJ551_09390 [Prevotella sp.]|nr:hypothetical protein [Prevotella sp.]
MKIEDFIKMETDRKEPARFSVVHLVKEGGFYRASDWSAWLLTQFPIGVSKEKPMNVTVKQLSNGYIHAFVGFPVGSIAKFIPNEETVAFQPVSDTQIDVTLNVDFGDATCDDIRQQVDEWKAGLPLNEGKQKRDAREATETAPRAMRLTDIMGQVLAFPLADKSPREAWEFVRTLQQRLMGFF